MALNLKSGIINVPPLRNRIRLAFLKRFSQSSSVRSLWVEPEAGYDIGIKVYNCITKSKVPLVLRNQYRATWYTCGPTVYDSTHIGHASCYVKLDIMQRILRNHFNIDLITAMNITDIDDKIIRKAVESNAENFQDISKQYENEFWKDLSSLNIQQPNIKIKVTENIPYIIQFIENLLQQGKAYVGKDDSVYFRVHKYKNYGKLQNINLNEIKDDSNKEADVDFALWKAQKDLNEPSWPVPWSSIKGRPGWHIECSALATKIFGDKIDFHAGGLDLQFPHHENEEAQSCCYHNTDQWVNYWIHTGHLNLKHHEQKMSKSLKNTISVCELLKKYSADEFRMACALSNYRNSMEFSDELMVLAKNIISKLNTFLLDCQSYLDGKKEITNIDSSGILIKLNKIQYSIDQAFKDDFDTSKCVSHLADFTSTINKIINRNDDTYTSSSMTEIAAAKNFVFKILNTLGFLQNIPNVNYVQNNIELDDFLDQILDIRYKIRQLAIESKNQNLFKICDEIRQTFKNKNIEIKDHNKGSSRC